MPVERVEALRCTCLRCGHVWVTVSEQPPPACARCRSRYWDRAPETAEQKAARLSRAGKAVRSSEAEKRRIRALRAAMRKK
jgi:predicted  nucleic acid-binding Zn-ribbon protein